MGLLLATGLAALIPSLLLGWFFRSRDAHPEPSGAVWGTFLLGVLSILPTLVLALPAALFVASLKLNPGPTAWRTRSSRQRCPRRP